MTNSFVLKNIIEAPREKKVLILRALLLILLVLIWIIVVCTLYPQNNTPVTQNPLNEKAAQR